MDFISSAILGGIIYDSLKFGAIKFGGLFREKLRKFSFSENELAIIENLVETNSLSKESTLEKINLILESSNEIQSLISKKNDSVTQINNVENNYGAIVGNNPGEIKIDIKK